MKQIRHINKNFLKITMFFFFNFPVALFLIFNSFSQKTGAFCNAWLSCSKLHTHLPPSFMLEFIKSKNLDFVFSTQMEQKQANSIEMYNFMVRQCTCSSIAVFDLIETIPLCYINIAVYKSVYKHNNFYHNMTIMSF